MSRLRPKTQPMRSRNNAADVMQRQGEMWESLKNERKDKTMLAADIYTIPAPLAPLMQSAVMVPRLGTNYCLCACFQ